VDAILDRLTGLSLPKEISVAGSISKNDAESSISLDSETYSNVKGAQKVAECMTKELDKRKSVWKRVDKAEE
jgi:hypothetical protein